MHVLPRIAFVLLASGNWIIAAEHQPTVACDSVEKVMREGWDARSSNGPISSLPSKPVKYMFIHHTGEDISCLNKDDCVGYVRSVQDFHMDVNGWDDIGYNFLVGEDGRGYEGRGWDKIGAHTYGYNSKAVAIAVIGDFTSRTPNAAALTAVKALIQCAIDAKVLASTYVLCGHRDVSNTACPGDKFYNEIKTWPHYSNKKKKGRCKKNQTKAGKEL